jgi:hypothetical protein
VAPLQYAEHDNVPDTLHEDPLNFSVTLPTNVSATHPPIHNAALVTPVAAKADLVWVIVPVVLHVVPLNISVTLIAPAELPPTHNAAL